MQSLFKFLNKPAIMFSRISVILFFFTFLLGMTANAQDSFTPYSAEVDESIGSRTELLMEVWNRWMFRLTHSGWANMKLPGNNTNSFQPR